MSFCNEGHDFEEKSVEALVVSVVGSRFKVESVKAPGFVGSRVGLQVESVEAVRRRGVARSSLSSPEWRRPGAETSDKDGKAKSMSC